MLIFYTLFFKLIPLYIFIFLGYISARKLKIQKEPIARLLLYIINPALIFYGTYRADLSISNLSLPLFFFIISCLASFIFYQIGRKIWKNDSTKNILAYTSGTGNTGYFGLPAALLIFDEKVFSLAALALFGFSLYENTVGFYVTARGNFTIKESFLKVFRLPAIYTFILGILINKSEIHISPSVVESLSYFKGAYSLLGMMIIGMGIAHLSFKRKTDVWFIFLTLVARFIFWPFIILSVVYFDRNFMHFFQPDAYKLLILFSCVPLAASTVVVSTELNVKPEKAAVAVLISTLCALIIIPLIISLFAF